MDWPFESGLRDVAWPAVPAPHAAALLALLHQLEQSQWLSPQRLRELQSRQLELLLRHAASSVPYYRRQWGGAAAVERFTELPLLTRRELQANYGELKSERVPPEHGATGEVLTSGSTGAPIRVLRTQLSQLFWNAITLREHLWHRRDLRGKLAAIRYGMAGAESPTWGQATAGVVSTGPAAGLGVDVDVDAQIAWLQRQEPDYLLTYPSNAAELARTCLRTGVRLRRLQQVRTMGEMLSPDVRLICREAWGVPIVDMYSAEEAGYIALQCPDGESYHVQAESLLVEILDEQGRPCAPGSTGRVVVTDLHNFAMPLVRYEIGDFAEAAPACPCGRGLPVLSRVAGRVRNMLVAADGKRYFPIFGTRSMPGFELLRQHQFVQKSLGLVEARLVTASPLGAQQEETLRRHLLARFPGFEVRLVYCASIPRSPSGKFEDFVSELPAS